jgi:hypothetical protein
MSITNNESSNSKSSIFGNWNPNSSNGGGGNGSVTNPLTANLNAGGYQITNTSNLLEIPVDQTLDMNNHAITGLTTITFQNDGEQLTSYQGNLMYSGDQVIRQGSSNFWLGDYTMGNNDISAIGTAEGTTSNFSTYTIKNNGSINFPNSRSIHLIPNGVDLAIGSNNSEIILTSVNIANVDIPSTFDSVTLNDDTISGGKAHITLHNGYIVVKDANNDEIGHIPYTTSDGEILTIGDVNFSDMSGNEHVLTTDNEGNLTYDSSIVLRENLCKTSELTLLENTTEHNIIVQSGVPKFDSYELITSNTVNSYVEQATGLTNYQKKVSENDLDMNNFNLENVNSITWNGANADGLVLSNNRLQFNDGTQIKRYYKQNYTTPQNSNTNILAVPITFVLPSIPNFCQVTINGLIQCIGMLSGFYTSSSSIKYSIVAKSGSDGIFTVLSHSQDIDYASTYRTTEQDDIEFVNSSEEWQIDGVFSYYDSPANSITNSYDVEYVMI